MVDELSAKSGASTLLIIKFARETCYYEATCHPARNLLISDYEVNSLIFFQ